MAERKMKLGFVGCGGFASGNHIPNAAANPNFEIRALCDLDKGHLDKLAETFKPAYVTTDMEKLFADPEIEAVICATKPDFRLPIMRLAVKNGKHLFVEKPLCYKEEDIPEMISLMRGAPIKFMVGFNRPYSPLMQDAKPFFKRYRKGNTTIIYRIVGEGRLWPKHHYDAVVNRGESTIIHEATHIFDLVNWFADALPSSVYTAGGGNLDNVITLKYPDATTAVIISGDNANIGYPKERLEINTNNSIIVGDEFLELNVYGEDGLHERRTYDYMMEGKKYNTSIAEATAKDWAWRQSVTPEERAYGYYYKRQLKVDKGHYNELEFFRKCIRGGEPVCTDVVKGAAASLTAWRAIESWRKGEALPLDFSHLK